MTLGGRRQETKSVLARKILRFECNFLENHKLLERISIATEKTNCIRILLGVTSSALILHKNKTIEFLKSPTNSLNSA